MGRAYQQHVREREAAARAREQEANVVYQNPVVNGGYDPDGLMELFGEDEIDWDGFDWDIWSWVIVPGEDWVEGQGHEVGTVADGAEINFDYYRQDPLYQMAFANLDFDAEDLSDLSVEDLQEATRHIVETFRGVRDGKYREPWKKDMPKPYKPTTLKTDYETPFDIPGIVPRSPGASMSAELQEFADTVEGADNYAWHERMMKTTKPQAGYKQEVDPNWGPDSWKPADQRQEERTGIGGQYVIDQMAAGKTRKQILRKATNKGWDIGALAADLLNSETDLEART